MVKHDKQSAALIEFVHLLWRRPEELRPYPGEAPLHRLWRCYACALQRARLYTSAELGELPPKFVARLAYRERQLRREWKVEELKEWQEFRRSKTAVAEGLTTPKPGDPDYEGRS